MFKMFNNWCLTTGLSVLKLLTYTSFYKSYSVTIVTFPVLQISTCFKWFGFKKHELVGKSSRREPRFDHFKFFVSVALTLNVMTQTCKNRSINQNQRGSKNPRASRTTGKYCFVAFIKIMTLENRLKRWDDFVDWTHFPQSRKDTGQ